MEFHEPTLAHFTNYRHCCECAEHDATLLTADIALCIPSTSVPRIQKAHMFIGHLICEMAQRMTTGDYQTRFAAHAVRA
jgi:hypothetical protein